MYRSRFSALITSSGFCSLSRSGRSRISMYSLRSAGPRWRCWSLCWARAGTASRTVMKIEMKRRFDRRSICLVPVVIGVAGDAGGEHDGQRWLVGLVGRRVVHLSRDQQQLVAWAERDHLALVSLDVLERQLELTLSHPDRDLVHLVVVHPGRGARLDLV